MPSNGLEISFKVPVFYNAMFLLGIKKCLCFCWKLIKYYFALQAPVFCCCCCHLLKEGHRLSKNTERGSDTLKKRLVGFPHKKKYYLIPV